MLRLSPGPLRTILCLGAHADDIEIGCGGTLLKLLAEQEQVSVHWIVFSGSAARAAEARRSADEFLRDAAAADVQILAFRDSFFPCAGAEIKEVFAQLAGSLSPDLIFTHRREDLHQDHRTLAELTWCAFRDHWVLEYEILKYEGDLGSPNVYVPLDAEVAQRKIGTLSAAFPSQREKPWFSPETFSSLLRIRGLECNSPSKFAEAFYCRKLIF
jgi:LmbE family N-acetylglucosaminyl deacetylase